MVNLPDSKASKVQFLVSRHFPGFPWSKHHSKQRASAKVLPEWQRLAEDYAKELSSKSESDLDRQYEAEWAKAANERRAKAEQEEAARAFNQPFASANVSHWAKMSYWTPDEAVALSLGRDPKVANWPAVQQLVSVSRFASEYASRRDIVMRAKAMGQLWEFTIPTMFLAWAERMEFPLSGDLVEAVKSLGNQVADWKSL
jgi:hypothetical protein